MPWFFRAQHCSAALVTPLRSILYMANCVQWDIWDVTMRLGAGDRSISIRSRRGAVLCRRDSQKLLAVSAYL